MELTQRLQEIRTMRFDAAFEGSLRIVSHKWMLRGFLGCATERFGATGPATKPNDLKLRTCIT